MLSPNAQLRYHLCVGISTLTAMSRHPVQYNVPTPIPNAMRIPASIRRATNIQRVNAQITTPSRKAPPIFECSKFEDVDDTYSMRSILDFAQTLLKGNATSTSAPSEGQVAIFSCSEGERKTLDVPLQRSFTGPLSVLSDDIASIPLEDLDPSHLLARMNFHLGTSYTLDPSRESLLECALHHSRDFGVAYALLRPRWSMDPDDAKQNIDKCRSAHDIARQNASDGRIPMHLMPRRMWDLWSNRVVPTWMVCTTPVGYLYFEDLKGARDAYSAYPRSAGTSASHADSSDPQLISIPFFAVSHPWVDANQRQAVKTPINGYEWPVPLPADTTLERIRTELLHLTGEMQLVWLDVLCLRQQDESENEHLRREEWRTDIPTIGAVYIGARIIVYYYSGLGLPFEIGNLNSPTHWLNRAWTLQETKAERRGLIAGIPASCPPHCSSGLAEWQNVKDLSVIHFCRRINSLRSSHQGANKSRDLFWAIAAMRTRFAKCELDKVAGLNYIVSGLGTDLAAPPYITCEDSENAWQRFVEQLATTEDRASLLFFFPYLFTGRMDMPVWLPSWQQLTDNCSTPTLGDRIFFESSEPRVEVFFDKDRREFWVNCRHIQCDIYGLSNAADNATGKVVICEGFQRFVFEALRDYEVPLPDGRYALLPGPSRFHKGSEDRRFIRCAVGKITPLGTFKKVAVLDIINRDRKFPSQPLTYHTRLA